MAQKPVVAEFYINNKGQLIKITEVERRGTMTQMHAIVSFDLNSMAQTNHSYVGPGAFGGAAAAGSVGLVKNIPRAKVPVRDGQS